MWNLTRNKKVCINANLVHRLYHLKRIGKQLLPYSKIQWHVRITWHQNLNKKIWISHGNHWLTMYWKEYCNHVTRLPYMSWICFPLDKCKRISDTVHRPQNCCIPNCTNSNFECSYIWLDFHVKTDPTLFCKYFVKWIKEFSSNILVVMYWHCRST